MRVTVRCPAKVNTFLTVDRPDAHGYHPIRTILQAIGLYDELTIDDEGEPGFFCDSPDVPAENTVTKALRLVSEFVVHRPLRIELTKKIPSEAGMGGGSSDAAGLLRVINKFLPAPMEKPMLLDVALAIGMDTPFFLIGGRARGEHYGEVLSPLPDGDPEWLVLAKPAVGMASGPAYRALDEKAFPFLEFPEGDDWHNDFERVAPCECLELIERLQVLGCDRAVLTGSGSAVIGRASDEADAERIADRLDAHWVEVARTLTRAESLS